MLISAWEDRRKEEDWVLEVGGEYDDFWSFTDEDCSVLVKMLLLPSTGWRGSCLVGPAALFVSFSSGIAVLSSEVRAASQMES